MEFSSEYEIKRNMHMRPYSQVVDAFIDIRKEHKGLQIKLEDSVGHEYDGQSIISLVVNGGNFPRGENVTVYTRGDFSLSVLEEAANSIGNIFSTEDDSRSTWEELYKSKYGRYPDEDD